MKIFKFNNTSKSGEEKLLDKCERVLRSSGIVVLPTDTVYGIVGRADSEQVIKKIFLLKKRPLEKALPVFVKSIAEARKFAYISDAKARFLEKVWPGPITVVFDHKGKLPDLLVGGEDTIGLRIPNNEFILELLSRCGFPLVQTSANISDKLAAKNIGEIRNYFEGSGIQPGLVVDGGEVFGKQSSVVDFTGARPRLLRSSAVSLEELAKIFKFLQR